MGAGALWIQAGIAAGDDTVGDGWAAINAAITQMDEMASAAFWASFRDYGDLDGEYGGTAGHKRAVQRGEGRSARVCVGHGAEKGEHGNVNYVLIE